MHPDTRSDMTMGREAVAKERGGNARSEGGAHTHAHNHTHAQAQVQTQAQAHVAYQSDRSFHTRPSHGHGRMGSTAALSSATTSSAAASSAGSTLGGKGEGSRVQDHDHRKADADTGAACKAAVAFTPACDDAPASHVSANQGKTSGNGNSSRKGSEKGKKASSKHAAVASSVSASSSVTVAASASGILKAKHQQMYKVFYKEFWAHSKVSIDAAFDYGLLQLETLPRPLKWKVRLLVVCLCVVVGLPG